MLLAILRSVPIFLFGSLCGAFFYRARGGFNPCAWGTTVTRLVFWAAPVGLAAWGIAVSSGPAGWFAGAVGLLTGLFAYLGLLLPHGSAADGSPLLEDALAMAQIGMMRGAAIALPLALVTPSAFLLPVAWALAGPAYWVGWRWLDGKDSRLHLWGKVFACGGSEWGEVLTGLATGAGLALVGVL